MADEEQDDESDRLILEELEVLQSIYIDELTVTHNTRGHPSLISLQLHPATGDDKDKKYVCMTLILEIPDQYPEKIPEIVIKNPRGIGEEEIQSLHADMVQLAEDRRGGYMLYEIIELAKESLTEGNIPHCPCTICYEHFHEGDNFTKTGCYHYFHQTCLSRYIEHTKAMLAEEKEDLPLHLKGMKNNEEKIPCPVCRENVTYDPEILTQSNHTEDSHNNIAISDDIRKWQREMADLLERQKQKGGVIDVEAEKNRFLVAPDEIVVIKRSNSPSNLQDEKSGEEVKEKERDRKMDKRMNDRERYRHYNDNYFKGRGRGQRYREEEMRKTSRERTRPGSGKTSGERTRPGSGKTPREKTPPRSAKTFKERTPPRSVKTSGERTSPRSGKTFRERTPPRSGKTSGERTLPRSGNHRDYDSKRDYRNGDKKREPEKYENKREKVSEHDKASSDILEVGKEASNKKEKQEKIVLEDRESKEIVSDDTEKNLKSDSRTASLSSEKNSNEDDNSDFKTNDKKSQKYSLEGTTGKDDNFRNKPQSDKTVSSSNVVEQGKSACNGLERVTNGASADYSKGNRPGHESNRPFGRGRGYPRGRNSSKGFRERADGETKMKSESSKSTENYEDENYHTYRNKNEKYHTYRGESSSYRDDRGRGVGKGKKSQGKLSDCYDSEGWDRGEEFHHKKENHYIQKRGKYHDHRDMHDSRNSYTKSANYNTRDKRDKEGYKRNWNSENCSPRRPDQETAVERKGEKSEMKNENVLTKPKENSELEYRTEIMATKVENDVKREKDAGQVKENTNVKFSKGRGKGRGYRSVEKYSDNDIKTGISTTNKLQDRNVSRKGESEHKSSSTIHENRTMENSAENLVTNNDDSVKNCKSGEHSVPPGFPTKGPPPGFTKISFDDRTSIVKPPPGFENVDKTS